jgi:hypothetical protein
MIILSIVSHSVLCISFLSFSLLFFTFLHFLFLYFSLLFFAFFSFSFPTFLPYTPFPTTTIFNMSIYLIFHSVFLPTFPHLQSSFPHLPLVRSLSSPFSSYHPSFFNIYHHIPFHSVSRLSSYFSYCANPSYNKSHHTSHIVLLYHVVIHRTKPHHITQFCTLLHHATVY